MKHVQRRHFFVRDMVESFAFVRGAGSHAGYRVRRVVWFVDLCGVERNSPFRSPDSVLAFCVSAPVLCPGPFGVRFCVKSNRF